MTTLQDKAKEIIEAREKVDFGEDGLFVENNPDRNCEGVAICVTKNNRFFRADFSRKEDGEFFILSGNHSAEIAKAFMASEERIAKLEAQLKLAVDVVNWGANHTFHPAASVQSYADAFLRWQEIAIAAKSRIEQMEQGDL